MKLKLGIIFVLLLTLSGIVRMYVFGQEGCEWLSNFALPETLSMAGDTEHWDTRFHPELNNKGISLYIYSYVFTLN